MKYIDIHTHYESRDPEVVALCYFLPKNTFDSHYPYQVTGCHPWKIEQGCNLGRLQRALRSDKVLALGETGLDAIVGTPMDTQEELFRAQLAVNNKPVIIHNVRAFSRLQSIRKDFPEDRWIIHGFNKGVEMAQQLLDLGCYISFGSHLIEKFPHVQEAFVETPLSRIFLETDDQTKYDIKRIYERACELKKISVDELGTVICENFETVFGKGICGLE